MFFWQLFLKNVIWSFLYLAKVYHNKEQYNTSHTVHGIIIYACYIKFRDLSNTGWKHISCKLISAHLSISINITILCIDESRRLKQPTTFVAVMFCTGNYFFLYCWLIEVLEWERFLSSRVNARRAKNI